MTPEQIEELRRRIDEMGRELEYRSERGQGWMTSYHRMSDEHDALRRQYNAAVTAVR